DTLNLKAALFAIERLAAETGRRLPVMASGTIVDLSGRTMTGQTVEAFWTSISHADLLSVGLNCSLGAREMRPYVEELSRLAPMYLSCYPNAGLPDGFGAFPETPKITAALLRDFAESGFVNIVGGCCGTTPDHIRALDSAIRDLAPRPSPGSGIPFTQLSGLETLTIRPDSNFIMIGERTNVTGSKRFAR